MWQTLPDDVRNVYVGPDDRIWCEYFGRDMPRDAADLRRRVEREWAKPTPQVEGVIPLLFEPGGRAWFTPRGKLHGTIFGYDGRTWVEHAIETGRTLRGNAASRGQSLRGRSNLVVGGTVFFIDGLGVETFKGKGWSYQALMTKSAKRQEPPRLLVEADGKGVVAVVPGGEARLWRWRDGKWTRAADPVGVGEDDRLALASDGLWTLTPRREFRFHPFDAGDTGMIPKLVDRLEALDAGVREHATLMLSGMGPSIIPALEKALADAQTPERTTRLQNVLAALRAGTPPAMRAFGAYLVRDVCALEYLPDRTVCVGARQIVDPAGKAVGPGLILRPSDGAAARVLTGEKLPGAFDYGPFATSIPTVVADGARVWLPRTYRPAAGPMTLLDLKTGDVVATLADDRYFEILGACGDGAMIVHGGPNVRGPMALYIPGAPDDRNVLPTELVRVLGPMTVIDSDGRLYATNEEQGLTRFDGKTWTPLGALKGDGPITAGVAGGGREGGVLVQCGETFALVLGDKVKTGADVEELIAANRDAVVAAFPQTTRARYTRPLFLNCFADAGGNVWLHDRERLRVLSGGRWLDTDLALRAAAGGRAGPPLYVSAVGDGSKVYVTDFTPNGGLAALGDVRRAGDEAAVVFTRTNQTGDMRAMDASVRDTKGALWVPVTWRNVVRDDAAGNGATGGQWATRFTERGIDLQLGAGAGAPFLIDRDGNLWLGKGEANWGTAHGFAIWRDGRVRHTVDVTGAGERFRLFADRPGSVWLWGDTGLQHFRAKNSAEPWAYAHERTYTPRDVKGRPDGVAFSSRGFVALGFGGSSRSREGASIDIVRLPQE
jgi:hypothetical protein